ncbi:hypothetical protein T265_11657 [Opisthorchis viverrini]|uniref:Uncharacterized protein n=1 Tax=Opisthorchis viverrini TaxID=6198 RepID=A0A074Z8S5_OPIVI|nr:hypothetical protein T265_11657 [Opisthorchis viverrini]KER19620.1 hypothetical protein T265_11657 [Opisthorchis viverrini]
MCCIHQAASCCNRYDIRDITIHPEGVLRFKSKVPQSSCGKGRILPVINKHNFERYTHLQINLVFTTDSTESLVYDIPQLKVLHTGRSLGSSRS